jgi:hypothetical protein
MNATSSGICVIFTVRASVRPIAPPMTSAPATQAIPAGATRPATVATTAIAMPIIPYRFPRREDSGFDSPPRLRMKRIVAAM